MVMKMFAEATTPPNESTREPYSPYSSCSGSESSNLTPKDWRKIQNIVNKTVMKVADRKCRKSLEYLGDKVISQSAEITLLKEGNKRLTQALQDEQKRKTRGKKRMEEFRTRDEGNATVFSPRKVQQLQELQQASKDKKVL
jgi:DNA replication protein DnaD